MADLAEYSACAKLPIASKPARASSPGGLLSSSLPSLCANSSLLDGDLCAVEAREGETFEWLAVCQPLVAQDADDDILAQRQ